MDGAAEGSSDDERVPLWSLPGLTNLGTTVQSRRPPSSPGFDESTSRNNWDYWDGGMTRRAFGTQSVVAPHEHEVLRAENAKLAQVLLQKEQQLKVAEQATRDLAAWTLDERKRLKMEALHQRLLRQDYETILRQRDEQVVYLLALHQEAKLDHARSLVREGEVMGRPVPTECLQKINVMRLQVGLPPIDPHGTVLRVLAEKGDGDAYARTTTQCVFSADDKEEGGVVEDDRDTYSPPDTGGPTSIIDQVDELIAEEKGRMASW